MEKIKCGPVFTAGDNSERIWHTLQRHRLYFRVFLSFVIAITTLKICWDSLFVLSCNLHTVKFTLVDVVGPGKVQQGW